MKPPPRYILLLAPCWEPLRVMCMECTVHLAALGKEPAITPLHFTGLHDRWHERHGG